jgi:hypothetical protein
MSWEDILKYQEPYIQYHHIEREIYGLIKEIKQTRSSQQFQENILQPIYRIMGSLKDTSKNRYEVDKFWDLKRELRRHLEQEIAPLNRNLAERIARLEHLK